MPKPTNTSPRALRVPKEILRRLAELAHVPGEQRTFFFESVLANVQTAHELDGLTKGALATKNGAALRRTAVTLLEVLSKLNQDEREFFEGILSGKSKFLFARISTGGWTGCCKQHSSLLSCY
jgi:hypothetical protein